MSWLKERDELKKELTEVKKAREKADRDLRTMKKARDTMVRRRGGVRGGECWGSGNPEFVGVRLVCAGVCWAD